MRLFAFLSSLDSELIKFEWLYETGSEFWFETTCEKVKSDFQNRNKTKIKKVPFIRDTLYVEYLLGKVAKKKAFLVGFYY